MSTEAVAERLGKLGNTVFEARNVDVYLKGNVFVPLAELNALRNEAAAGLAQRRAALYRRECESPSLPAFPAYTTAKPALAVLVSSLSGLEEAVRGGGDVVYLDAPLSDMEAAVSSYRDIKLWLCTPRIVKDSEMLAVLEILKLAEECRGVVVANAGVLTLACRKNLPLIADSPLNTYNRLSASFLKQCGAKLVTASPELTLGEIREMARSFPVEVIAEGRLELMVSEAGLLPSGGPYELEDNRGFSFPAFTDKYDRTHILNSRKLSLLDRLPDPVRAGIAGVRIDARYEEDIAALTAAYRQALDSGIPGKRRGKEYTRGHYYRGVL